MNEITLAATLENIDLVTDFVSELLDANGCSMRVQTQINIAIDELFSNFWAIAENFRHQYCGLHEIIEAEKNAYTPEPNGTLVTGEVIAKDVEKEKTSAHYTSANIPKQP